MFLFYFFRLLTVQQDLEKLNKVELANLMNVLSLKLPQTVLLKLHFLMTVGIACFHLNSRALRVLKVSGLKS